MAIPKRSQLNFVDLPMEIRLLILRLVIPEEYYIDLGEKPPLYHHYRHPHDEELLDNPALSLLLVNHQLSTEIARLSSVGIVRPEMLPFVDCTCRMASYGKRKSISLIQLLSIQTTYQKSARVVACETEDHRRMIEGEQGDLALLYDSVVKVKEERHTVDTVLHGPLLRCETWFRVAGAFSKEKERGLCRPTEV